MLRLAVELKDLARRCEDLSECAESLTDPASQMNIIYAASELSTKSSPEVLALTDSRLVKSLDAPRAAAVYFYRLFKLMPNFVSFFISAFGGAYDRVGRFLSDRSTTSELGVVWQELSRVSELGEAVPERPLIPLLESDEERNRPPTFESMMEMHEHLRDRQAALQRAIQIRIVCIRARFEKSLGAAGRADRKLECLAVFLKAYILLYDVFSA